MVTCKILRLSSMEALKVTVQGLASYLMIISLLGTTTKVWNFVTSASFSLAPDIVPCNGSVCSHEKYEIGRANGVPNQLQHEWGEVLLYLEIFYEYTFPVIIPIFSKDLNNTNLRKAYPAVMISKLHHNNEGISTSTFLATLLPSFFLFKGAFQINYSNCKFWYYSQVASLLLTCFKMVLVTLLDLWDVTTNGVLVSVLLGLSQLWLVQSFMERLGRQKKSHRQTMFVSQLLALNDLDSFEICKIVGRGDVESDNASEIHCDKSYAEVSLISK